MPEKNNRGLKPGWRIVKFGDVVSQVKDRVPDAMTSGHTHYVRGEDFVPGQIKLGSKSLLGDGQHGPAFHMQFKKGDVLYVSRNPRLRKAAVADFDGICANTTYVCRSDTSKLLQELLPFIMQTESFSEYAKRHQRGSTNFYVNWSDIDPYEFALPPMEEQRRTLALLTAGLSTIDELRNAIVELPILRRSIETRLLSMDGVPKQKVGDVAKFTSGRGIRVSDLPKAPSDMNPVPVYGGNGISGYTGAVMDGTFEPTVVIGRVGQFCGVTSMTAGPCWITDNALYPVKMSPDIYPEFLAICLRASNLNRSKLGEYLPLITQEVVHKVEIPVPSRSYQSAAIKEFAQIDAAETSLISRLSSTRSLVMRVASQMLEGSASGI